MKHFLTACLALAVMPAMAQRIALKSNALLLATATPNLELETRLAPRVTANFAAMGNFIKVGDYKPSFVSFQPQVRYYFERPMARHFLGVGALLADYDMELKDTGYDGYAVGGGLVYGYTFVLGNHWNIEASIGAALAQCKEDKYALSTGKTHEQNNSTLRVLPMSVGVTLAYIIK